ncbi:MAG: DUF4013 domain-containing protein [Halococcoides sp.]
MVDFKAALRYPLEDDDWVPTVGIGGGLLFANTTLTFIGLIAIAIFSVVLIGFLLFPPLILVSLVFTLPLSGYSIAVLRSTIRGEEEPPRFTDWKQLYKDGLVAVAIALAYLIPPVVGATIVLAVTGVPTLLLVLFEAGESLVGLGVLFVMLGIAVVVGAAFVYSFAMSYLVPVSLAIYAHESDLRTALTLDRIKQVGLSSEFAVYWLSAIVINMIASQFIGFFMLIVVGFFMQFYLQIVIVRLYGLGYASAMDLESAPA